MLRGGATLLFGDDRFIIFVRAEFAGLLDDLGNELLELRAFGGGNPREMNAARVDADRVEEFAEEPPTTTSVEVARGVVAVARVATGNKHRVGADLERLHEEVKVDAPGAGQTNDADVSRVFEAVRAGQVGAQIGAPVANERDDFRLETAGCFRFGIHKNKSL